MSPGLFSEGVHGSPSHGGLAPGLVRGGASVGDAELLKGGLFSVNLPPQPGLPSLLRMEQGSEWQVPEAQQTAETNRPRAGGPQRAPGQIWGTCHTEGQGWRGPWGWARGAGPVWWGPCGGARGAGPVWWGPCGGAGLPGSLSSIRLREAPSLPGEP